MLLSWWLTRAIASDLFGVRPMDPVMVAGACAALLGAVVMATLVPARRATRIDPAAALRGE